MVQVHPRAQMKTKTYSWREIVDQAIGNKPLTSNQDLSSLITYARKKGVGQPVSYQKTTYSLTDISHLETLIRWWDLLNQETANEWRDNKTTAKIQEIVVSSVLTEKPIELYAIFCPSYKKGIGAIGYTGVTGNYTQSIISKLSVFVEKSLETGVRVTPVVYFSDLLLENYSLLEGTSYRIDLQNNYDHFRNLVQTKSNGLIRTKKLSEISEFLRVIGEQGITSGPIEVHPQILERIFTRGKTFYQNSLGWDNQQIMDRTNTLARCYSFMGEYFRKHIPLGIMYWTESAYERGVMYSGLHNEPLPIIYPQKTE